ncbi:hypothetical protein K0M31_016001 [Melipona bicolor]|uniref:Uncharacterized protein n=1 Tax=Melipona bicolor TaxID=60889 RepID=A0AA40G652_9HYME|nr:hypothetical protein K0M31_016001 [Melipona bicolor]
MYRSDNVAEEGEMSKNFSWKEVSTVMKNMKNGETTGGDGISINFYKALPKGLIFGSCYESNFEQCLKAGEMHRFTCLTDYPLSAFAFEYGIQNYVKFPRCEAGNLSRTKEDFSGRSERDLEKVVAREIRFSCLTP